MAEMYSARLYFNPFVPQIPSPYLYAFTYMYVCITGCEFFKDYKDNGYNAVALKFDWKQVIISFA